MASSLRMLSPSNLLVPASQPSGDCRRAVGLWRPTRGGAGRCRAMVQYQSYQGSAANYAKEMERLSAKESLLLAFKDAGGFESLVGGKTTELQRVDVNERIIGLERLNPTPRPTTPVEFRVFGSGSPGLFSARFLYERLPVTLANFVGLSMLIKDGYANVTANLKFFNSIESKFLLSTKLSVEGPLRLKEEYVEGIFETPTVSEQAIPEQLKGAIRQAAGSLQQLPAPIKDSISNGLKIPLRGTYQRLFMISYLDDEILIIRDSAGAPDVLTRLEGPPSPLPDETIAAAEYES